MWNTLMHMPIWKEQHAKQWVLFSHLLYQHRKLILFGKPWWNDETQRDTWEEHWVCLGWKQAYNVITDKDWPDPTHMKTIPSQQRCRLSISFRMEQFHRVNWVSKMRVYLRMSTNSTDQREGKFTNLKNWQGILGGGARHKGIQLGAVLHTFNPSSQEPGATKPLREPSRGYIYERERSISTNTQTQKESNLPPAKCSLQKYSVMFTICQTRLKSLHIVKLE